MKYSWGRRLYDAARANFFPALALQAVAALILWTYYYSPAGHVALNELARWKQTTGFVFAFVSSALAGALLPFFLQGLQRGDHRRIAGSALIPLILFWGVRGWIVDGFYQLQALLWGDNAHALTIVIKIVFDLAVFSPLIAIPSVTLMFSLVDSNFNRTRFYSRFEHGFLHWWLHDVCPLWTAACFIWLPAIAVIYALPSGLQFPVQAIVQCFWSLVLVVITDRTPKTSTT